MKHRPALAGLGLLLVATAPGVQADTTEPDLAVDRVQFATTCVQNGADPRCVSNEYKLSLDPGAASVGNALTITPAGYVFWTQEGYTTTSYSADSTLRPQYVLDGGSEITGQVTIRNTPRGTPTAAADSGVFVEIAGSVRTGTRPNGTPIFTAKTIGSGEITKLVVAPGDHVYAFTFTVPEELDGVAVERLTAAVGQRHIGAGYGFMDGQGGSFFDLPYVVPTDEAPAEEPPVMEPPAE